MSKLNWEKLNRQSRQQSYLDKTADVSMNYDDLGLWSLRGKHYGTHIHKLPTDYLFWIIDNSTSGKYKGIAENEIYRRYSDLSNT